jgi:hypothetical protein
MQTKFGGKFEAKSQLRTTDRWKNNIKVNPKEL